jgi:hypothetical protein
MPSTATGTASSTCGNCGTPLQGRFCHRCGQKDVDPTGTLHEFAHDAWHEFAHVDGKLLQTVRWLVTRPGGLTREVLAGRRTRYASPLRLYLTCSLLFFALTAIAPRRTGIITYRDTSSAPRSEAERLEIRQRGEQMQDAVAAAIGRHMPRAMFVLMPFFAMLAWAAFRRQYRHYMPHLFFSLHFHAFVFLALAVSVCFNLIGGWGELVGGLVPLAMIPYYYVSLRRVFGSTWVQVIAKGTAMAVVYFVALAGVLALITLGAVRDARP